MSGDIERGGETVLVVDDDELVRSSMSRALRRLGYEVIQAESGADALEKIAKLRPAVVIVDLRMPGMDGHTLLRRLNGTPAPPGVVVISGGGDMDDVVDALRAGAADYLKKPWSAADLMSAVSRALDAVERRRPRAARTIVGAGEVHAPDAPVRGDGNFKEVLERLRRGEIPLPAVPAVLVSLRAMVMVPDCNLDAIASKIETDQRLSVDILRMANAAHFARLGRATSVRVAVQRLGLRHVHNLVETLFLQGFCKGREGRTRDSLTQVWRRSVARAIAMRALADLAPAEAQVDGDVAYLCGLMADVGASLLLWVDSERGGTGMASTPAGSDPRGPTVLQRHHEDLGAMLLERWGFEGTVVALARHHHQAAEPESGTAYWRLAVLAGALTSRLLGNEDLTEHAPPPATVTTRCAHELQLSDAVFTRLSAQLQTEISAIVQSVG